VCRFLHCDSKKSSLPNCLKQNWNCLLGYGGRLIPPRTLERPREPGFQELVQLPSTKVQFFERGFLTLQKESGTSQVAGATEDDLQRLLYRFVYRPLLKLGDHSKEASIHAAEIEEVEQE